MAKYEFTSSRDKANCFRYITKTFEAKRYELPLDLISALLVIDHTSGDQELADFWDLFITTMFRNQKLIKEKDKVKKLYPWGVWRINTTGAIDDAPTLWKGTVSREDDGAYQIHQYEYPLMKIVPAPETPPSGGGFNLPIDGEEPDPEPEIVWELMVAKQQDMDVMIGSVNVGEIDAVCAVPHLPNFASTNQGSTLLAKWSLNPKLGLSQWQRRPNPVRIQAITNFMNASKSNLIINSIMLYIPEGAKGVEIEKLGKTAKVKIYPRKFLAAIGSNLTDVIVKRDSEGNAISFNDQRPIWIVDGQHRTRGMALSQRGASLNVPIILTHGIGENSVDLGSVAKVFTEINTLAKPLDEYQQHYLSHKFSIVAAEADKTYGRPENATDPKDEKNRRVNKLLYELACKLTDSDGPFENGVQLVDGRGAATLTRIKLPEFLKQLRSFFTSGVYSDESLTIEEIYTDFTNYLSAWENTANHEQFKNRPNTLRWEPNNGRLSELEKSQPIVHIIFMMLPFFKKLLDEKGLEGTETNYTNLLSPITGVDWLCPKLEARFKGQYREGPKWMAIWIKQAILYGEYRTHAEVTSDDVNAVHHGMALYAEPSEPVIEAVSGAVGVSFTLTWEHGNVYRTPIETWVIQNGRRFELDSEPDWDFPTPGEESNEPSIATYSFMVPYLEEGEENMDWTVHVRIPNIWANRVIEIDPNEYLDD